MRHAAALLGGRGETHAGISYHACPLWAARLAGHRSEARLGMGYYSRDKLGRGLEAPARADWPRGCAFQRSTGLLVLLIGCLPVSPPTAPSTEHPSTGAGGLVHRHDRLRSPHEAPTC